MNKKKIILFFWTILFFLIYLVLAVPLITFTGQTPANNILTTNTSIEINISIIEPNLDSLIYNWNGINYSFYDKSLLLHLNFNNNSDIGDNSTFLVDNSKYKNNATMINSFFDDFEFNAGNWSYRDGSYTINRDCTDSSRTCSINITTTSTWGSVFINQLNSYSNNYTVVEFDYNCEDSDFHWGLLVYDTDWRCIQGTGTSGCGSTYTAKGALSPAITCDNTWRHANYTIQWGTGTISQTLLGDWNAASNTANKKLWIDNFQIYTVPSPNYTSGKYGNSINFNGVSDSIKIINSQSLNFSKMLTNYTVSLWFKTSSLDRGLFQIENAGYDRLIYLNGSGQLCQRIWDSETICTSGINYADNNWHQVIQWLNSSVGQRIYVDGKQVASGTKGSSDFNWAGWAMIGFSNDPANDYFNGLIDEVMIWNRSLTEQEIYQQYVSNLQKFNQTQWNLYVNQSKNATAGLDYGIYTYQVFAENTSGGLNYSELRTIAIQSDIILPQINFTLPTPTNATTTINTSIIVNVSIDEQNLNSLIYNWNSTNFTIYNDSLVLMYNFDNLSSLGESQTKVVDISRYSTNGTFIDNAFINMTNGKYGGGLQLDGSSDYVNITDNPNIDVTENFTYSAWINPKEYGSCDGIMSKYHVGWGNGPILRLKCASPYNTIDFNELVSTKVIDLNSWTYVAGVMQRGIAYIYINGVLNTSGSPGYTVVNNAEPLTIGVDFLVGARYFNGSIDEVRIWNKSLSAEEIYQQYVSNLQKFNQTQWYLYVNQSKNGTAGLDAGTYTYREFATDLSGNSNSTEQRTIIISSSSCPSTPQNWNVNMADNLIINSLCNLTGYNITFSGTGNFTINNTFYVDELNSFSSGMIIWMKPNGILYPGVESK